MEVERVSINIILKIIFWNYGLRRFIYRLVKAPFKNFPALQRIRKIFLRTDYLKIY